MELLVQVRILAGQCRPGALLLLVGGLVLGSPMGPPTSAMGSVALAAQARTPLPAADSLELHRAARSAQAVFERNRRRLLPRTSLGGGGSCDERIGRFCSWYDEGDWAPEPEDPETTARRDELLGVLDSVAAALPGDGWVAGQAVWYRFEVGRFDEARAAARRCGGTAWWCAALEGLTLHGLGRWPEAEASFLRALADMDPREARAWRFPAEAVDDRGRTVLDSLASEAARAEAINPFRPEDDRLTTSPLLERFWFLADPLWLVEGNDRRTAHYARWTTSLVRVGARNPYGISWGRDLEELTVRHGWERGWEQGWTRPGRETDVVGHKHPEGRDFFPPGAALDTPADATADDLEPNRTRPRSLYAPDYAPLFLPLEPQFAVFPRGDSVAVVATHYLPADTSWHRTHDHARPWLEAGDQAGRPERAGLFLLHTATNRLHGVPVEPEDSTGALVTWAPAGELVASVERWSPERRRAGRLRRGVRAPASPPDVAILSDLLLVRAGTGEPGTLEEAAAAALPRPRIRADEAVGVVWEVGGLGWRPETLRYSLAVRDTGRNLLERVGGWLGLGGDDEALRLSWEEPGPDEPGVLRRSVEVETAALEPGRYEVVLELGLPGRDVLRRSVELQVSR